MAALWAGCSPVDSNFNRLPGAGESPSPDRELLRPEERPQDGHATGRNLKPDVREERPPDWQERHQALRQELVGKFTPPKPGEEILVTLVAGTEKIGKVAELTPDQLVLEMEDATITYPKEALTPESRLRFIEEDFVNFHANRKLKEEQRAYEARLARMRAERELQRLASITETPDFSIPETFTAKIQPTPRPTLPGISDGPPVNNPSDASVQQVRAYLTAHTRNAETIRYLEWTRVVPHPDGYSVRCMYEVDTDAFGRITENKVFYMDKAGHVTNVSGGTQTVRNLDL